MPPLIKPLFLFFCLTSAVLASSATEASEKEAPANRLTLQELFIHSDEKAVHAALHLLSDKFQDGIFSTDSSALEAIHSEDAPLATRVLKLARRQGGEGNSSSVPVSNPPSTTSLPPNVPSSTNNVQQTTTATQPNPSSTAASSQSESQSNPSSSQPPASSASSGSTASSPPSITVISGSSVTVVPSTLTTATSTSGPQLTTESGTIYIASSSITTSFTSTLKQTVTLPNGSLSTFTSLAVVEQTLGVVATNPGASASSSPGLISGASPTKSLTVELLAVLGGAVVVAMVL